MTNHEQSNANFSQPEIQDLVRMYRSDRRWPQLHQISEPISHLHDAESLFGTRLLCSR